MQIPPLVYGIGYDPGAGKRAIHTSFGPFYATPLIGLALMSFRSPQLEVLIFSGLIAFFIAYVIRLGGDSGHSEVALSGNGVEFRGFGSMTGFTPYSEIYGLSFEDNCLKIETSDGPRLVSGQIANFEDFHGRLQAALLAPEERRAEVVAEEPRTESIPSSWRRGIGVGPAANPEKRVMATHTWNGVAAYTATCAAILITSIPAKALSGGPPVNPLTRLGLAALLLAVAGYIFYRRLKIEFLPEQVQFRDRWVNDSFTYSELEVVRRGVFGQIRNPGIRPVWFPWRPERGMVSLIRSRQDTAMSVAADSPPN